jgi:hypothetical protein
MGKPPERLFVVCASGMIPLRTVKKAITWVMVFLSAITGIYMAPNTADAAISMKNGEFEYRSTVTMAAGAYAVAPSVGLFIRNQRVQGLPIRMNAIPEQALAATIFTSFSTVTTLQMKYSITKMKL